MVRFRGVLHPRVVVLRSHGVLLCPLVPEVGSKPLDPSLVPERPSELRVGVR